MLGQFAQFATSTIDNILAGHLNTRVLGAVAVGGGIWALPFVFVVGSLLALAPIVASLDGSGRRAEVAELLPQAVWLGAGLGVACGAALFILGPPILDLARTSPAIRPGAVRFLHAAAFSLPGIGLFAAARGISEGLSRTLPSMLVQFAGLALLAPLGYVLMYGAFGLPALGALGSGMATSIALTVEGLAYLAYVRYSASYAPLDRTRLDWRPSGPRLARILRPGLPIGATLVMEVGMFTTASLVIASLGAVEVAGNQIALNIVTLTFILPLGVASAVSVRVGRAEGQADAVLLARTIGCGLLVAIGFELVSFALLLAFRHTLVGLYSDDRAVVATGARLLLFGALFQIPDGIQVLCGGALRGLRDTRAPMLVTAASYWLVGVPVGAALAMGLGWGAAGMWTGLIAGLCVAALLLGLRVRSRVRLVAHPGGFARLQSRSTT